MCVTRRLTRIVWIMYNYPTSMAKTTTVNISLPVNMYKDAKAVIEERGYSSVSEIVRDALRRLLYPHLTVNGFTPEFEERVLLSAQEPIEESRTIDDLDAYFAELDEKLELRRKHNDQNKRDRRVRRDVRRVAT